MTDDRIIVPKWKERLNDNERRRALGQTTAKLHRVSCPYCQIGAAIVEVENKGGALQFPLREPVKCETCRKHFQLKVKVQLYGEKFNGS